MCLILFSVSPDDEHQLVVAANRDEQHARPTLAAGFWTEHPQVLGGRDLKAGGTWLGVSNTGRFAAVTNFAEPPPEPLPPKSRGLLTADFLSGSMDCQTYLENIAREADAYRGFNLVVFDGSRVCYFSNRAESILELGPGYYGLSNQLLDCDWPKVISGRAQLEEHAAGEFQVEALFELLAARGDESPHTARFILGENYGTCAGTVVKVSSGGLYFEERTFDPAGAKHGASVFELAFEAGD